MNKTKDAPPKNNVTLIVLAVSGGIFAILQSGVGPALPLMQDALGADQQSATWIMTAYLLSASVMTPVLGRLGDTYGKQRMLLVTMAALAIGCAISALAPTIDIMIAGRLVQGIGGGIFPLAFGILRDELHGFRLHRAIGILSGIGAAAAGAGAAMAGVIISIGGFRMLFWGPLIIVVICLAIAAVFLQPSPRVHAPITWGSVFLFALWMVSLMLILGGGQLFEATFRTLVLLILTGAGFLAWVLVERRASGPLIDLTMMRSNTMWTTSASVVLLGVALYGMQTFLPQFVQAPTTTGYGLGMTALESGLAMLPMTAGIFVIALSNAWFVRRFGARTIMITGPAVASAGIVLLLIAHDSLLPVLVANGLVGLGIGLPLAAMASLVISSVPRHQSGAAGGINANLRNLGGALGASVMAAFIASGGTAQQRLPTEAEYMAGFAVVAIATAAAAAIGLWVREPSPAEPAEEHAAPHPTAH